MFMPGPGFGTVLFLLGIALLVAKEPLLVAFRFSLVSLSIEIVISVLLLARRAATGPSLHPSP